MNQRTTYEITIADKLGQLPLPDLREAIWSRIEDQLDNDMPEGEDPGPSAPDTPKWASFTRRFGFFAVIVAAVTIFFITRKDTTPANNQDNVPTSVNDRTAPIDNNSSGSPPGNISAPVPAGNDVVVSAPNIPLVAGDSVINIPAPFTGLPPVVDSTPAVVQQDAPPPIQQSIPAQSQDTLPKKKSKGFKGLTDDDYKISLKKDSVKKG